MARNNKNIAINVLSALLNIYNEDKQEKKLLCMILSFKKFSTKL